MRVTRRSMLTGEVNTLNLPVTEEQIRLYQQGTLAQNAFPNLTPNEREFFMTGITAEEWARL